MKSLRSFKKEFNFLFSCFSYADPNFMVNGDLIIFDDITALRSLGLSLCLFGKPTFARNC